MCNRGQNRRLWLSYLALFLIAFVLPFHSHAEKSNTDLAKAHCVTCQFSSHAQTLAPVAPVQMAAPHYVCHIIALATSHHVAYPIERSTSPRAPPLA